MTKEQINFEIQRLKDKVEIEESNYKRALELRKEYKVLRQIRENIKSLKHNLEALIKQQTIANS